jgi:hypothetical protein
MSFSERWCVRPNKRIHTDKIKLRRVALHLYFPGDAGRYAITQRPLCLEKLKKWYLRLLESHAFLPHSLA